MRNPFEYGGVVSGEAFCNRKKETSDLVRAMENGEKLFVFSERRYGKTSLVRAALGKLPRKGYVCAYVDLWPTDSEATFVTTVAKTIADDAFNRNMELGMLVRDETTVLAIAEHFRELIQRGVLVEVKPTNT
jgi:Archaeal ATPase.